MRHDASLVPSVSDQYFRIAFEAASSGMALTTVTGRWLTLNRALHEMLGYSEAEFMELTNKDLSHPDDHAYEAEMIPRLLRGELANHRREKRYIHKDGHIVWALLSIAVVRDEEGQALGCTAQIQDITALKRAEQELRE